MGLNINKYLREYLDRERLDNLEKKVDDVKAMTKHSHPALKLKGNQNFDEIREIHKEISSLREVFKTLQHWKVETNIQIAELKELMKVDNERIADNKLCILNGKRVLRELILCTYNLHQAILTNTSLKHPLAIGEALFQLYEKLDSKEYIASLNDPKAFEGVNLGTLHRSRKLDAKDGEKSVATIEGLGGSSKKIPHESKADSTPSKYECICCGSPMKKWELCPICLPKESTEDYKYKIRLFHPKRIFIISSRNKLPTGQYTIHIEDWKPEYLKGDKE